MTDADLIKDTKHTPRVLIVEDDPFIAIDLEDAYLEAGFEVIGPFARSEDAVSALKAAPTCKPDIATLDYNLMDGTSRPVAAALNARDIPFLMVTSATDDCASRPMFKNRPIFPKPFNLPKLIRASERLAYA